MIELPPPRYDHPCTATEFVLSAQDVVKVCGGDAIACTIMSAPGGPLVILPKVGRGGVTQRTQDLLRRHECGHVNGWSNKHETKLKL